MFKRIHSHLPEGREALERHVKALGTMLSAQKHQAVFDHLYETLSILDSKSATLLQFNSVLIAVFAIYLQSNTFQWAWVWALLGLIVVLVSSCLLLLVVWVHWSSTEEMERDPDLHAYNLMQVRQERTVSYRLAWNFSVASVLILLVLAGHLVIERL